MSQELMTLTQAQESLAPILHGMDILEQGVKQVIGLLPSMSDDGLHEVAEYSNRMAEYAWVLRGSVVREIRSRVATRQVGGHGKKDEDGTGIKAHLARLAGESGVSVRTLEAEAQVLETFDVESRAVDGIPLLPKSYFIEALNAPDPQAALAKAEKRVAEGNYSTAAFRNEIQQERRKDESAVHGTPSQSKSDEKWLSCPVEAEVYDVLDKMATQEHLSLRYMVEKSILTLQSVKSGQVDVPTASALPLHAVQFSEAQYKLLASAWFNSGEDSTGELPEFIVHHLVDPLTGMLFDKAPAEEKKTKVKGRTVDELLADPAFVEAAQAMKRDELVTQWVHDASRDAIREAWRTVKSRDGE